MQEFSHSLPAVNITIKTKRIGNKAEQSTNKALATRRTRYHHDRRVWQQPTSSNGGQWSNKHTIDEPEQKGAILIIGIDLQKSRTDQEARNLQTPRRKRRRVARSTYWEPNNRRTRKRDELQVRGDQEDRNIAPEQPRKRWLFFTTSGFGEETLL